LQARPAREFGFGEQMIGMGRSDNASAALYPQHSMMQQTPRRRHWPAQGRA